MPSSQRRRMIVVHVSKRRRRRSIFAVVAAAASAAALTGAALLFVSLAASAVSAESSSLSSSSSSSSSSSTTYGGPYKRPWLRPPPPRLTSPAPEGFFLGWTRIDTSASTLPTTETEETATPTLATTKRRRKRRKKALSSQLSPSSSDSVDAASEEDVVGAGAGVGGVGDDGEDDESEDDDDDYSAVVVDGNGEGVEFGSAAATAAAADTTSPIVDGVGNGRVGSGDAAEVVDELRPEVVVEDGCEVVCKIGRASIDVIGSGNREDDPSACVSKGKSEDAGCHVAVKDDAEDKDANVDSGDKVPDSGPVPGSNIHGRASLGPDPTEDACRDSEKTTPDRSVGAFAGDGNAIDDIAAIRHSPPRRSSAFCDGDDASVGPLAARPVASALSLLLRRHFTPDRIIRLSLTAAQLGIAWYLCKAIWEALVEALEELSKMDADGGVGGGGGSGGGAASATQEEHDRPFLTEEGVDAATGVASHPHGPDADADGKAGGGGARRRRTAATFSPTSPTAATAPSDLARRLLASGMPMDDLARIPENAGREAAGAGAGGNSASSAGTRGTGGTTTTTTPTVRRVLRSLTRTEGRLLSNALLSPVDCGDSGYPIDAGVNAESAERKRNRIARMWNDIGGLEHVKEALLDLVFPMLLLEQRVNRVKDGALVPAAAAGGGGAGAGAGAANGRNGPGSYSSYYGGLLSNPPGVLLYGPPGCGKTTLVRALASTANARVLVVTPSTLLRKYVGETELQVRALFSLARKIAPTIIFVDELDGLFRDRGEGGSGGEHEVNRDLKTEFMQLWDGVITRGDSGGGGTGGGAGADADAAPQVLVIGATNRPFDVDPGFLRRMPRSFYVGPPDFGGRCSVLRSMLSDVPLSPDFDLEAVARATEGYTPSDIREVLRTAALYPLREARRRATEKVEEMRRSRERGEESAPSQQFWGMPPLRPLSTDDVLRARAAVAPTHLGQGYRAALAEYAARVGVGAASSDRGSRGRAFGFDRSGGGGGGGGGRPRAYQHPHGYAVHKSGDGTFYADVGTATPLGMRPPEYLFDVHSPSDVGGGGAFGLREEELGSDSESANDLGYDDEDDVDSEGETSGSSGGSSSSFEDDDL